MLFFNLFNIQCSSDDSKQGHGLLSLMKGRKMFEVYVDSVKHFKDRSYLVSLITKVNHASISDVQLFTP